MDAKQRLEVERLLRRLEVEAQIKFGVRIKCIAFDLIEYVISPKEVLTAIATSIGMSYEDYQIETKGRDYADLRKISAKLLKEVYPEMSNTAIAKWVGWGDHSSVTTATKTLASLLETKDMLFMYKYNCAVEAIEMYSYKRIEKHPLTLTNEDAETKTQDQAKAQ